MIHSPDEVTAPMRFAWTEIPTDRDSEGPSFSGDVFGLHAVWSARVACTLSKIKRPVEETFSFLFGLVVWLILPSPVEMIPQLSWVFLRFLAGELVSSPVPTSETKRFGLKSVVKPSTQRASSDGGSLKCNE